MIPPGGDWVTQRKDGSFKLDVKMTLETNDGALIFVSYFGIVAFDDGAMKARSAPLVETGDERDAWRTHVQGVGSGGLEGPDVVYAVAALR